MIPKTTEEEHPGDAVSLKYRPDIDGLRAVAVASVLLFHLGFDGFRGGFVGVDVFFVISGFLITRLIRDEYYSTGTFSFRGFYLRRVRRLVPAQLFVLFFSTIWAIAVLAPPHLESYGGSLASALLSSSNIFFWSEAGYFNAGSAMKPLLHTWSLGVEEQFYLVWPAALVFALRTRRRWMAPALLVLAGAVSLALNQIFADGCLALANSLGLAAPPWLASKEWFSDGPATIFYLLPFRVFEFVMGAILVWLLRFQPRSQSVLDACVVTGLALMGWAVLRFDETIVFPSWSALVPCAGAALCIYAGQARRSGILLRNRAAVAIGLMSYSLYLVHWPLIVFRGYSASLPLPLHERFVILGLCLVVAQLMLTLVEQPFRRPSPSTDGNRRLNRRRRLTGLAAIAAVLLVVGASMWTTNGWAWRFSGTIVAEEMRFDVDELNQFVWRRLVESKASFTRSPAPKMLIVGDSMAADFANVAFAAGLAEEFEIRSLPIRDDCQAILPLAAPQYKEHRLKPSCPEQHRRAEADPNWKHADVVVVAFLWNDLILNLLREQIDRLRTLAPHAEFVLVGPKAQDASGLEILSRIAREGSPDLSGYTTPFPDLQRLVLHQLQALADKIDASVFDVSNLFCPGGRCRRFNDFGNMLVYDNMHLTPKGAEYLGKQLRTRIENYPYFRADTFLTARASPDGQGQGPDGGAIVPSSRTR